MFALAAFLVLGGCGHTTEPGGGASVPAEVTHLTIASVGVEALVNVEGSRAIAGVLGLLSEEQVSTLVEDAVLCVDDPSVALAIAVRVGLDTSDPAVAEGGGLMTSLPATWGQLKCCYLYGGECCPKKKQQ